MSQKRICLMNDSFPPAIDGVANAVCNYARILTETGQSATVVTPFYPDAEDDPFPFPVLRYPSLDTTKLVGYRAGLPFAPETMEKLTASGFDLIHSHCPISSTILARLLREQIHVPLVFTYHTKFDIDIANAIRAKLMQEEAAKLLVDNISACDEVWTVSRGAGENLRKLGYPGDYLVMPNGVDLPRGQVSPALIREATKDYPLPDGVPVFLFVGRMMWYKGIRIILDALEKLHQQGQDFRMVFVGGGRDKEEIQAYAQNLQAAEKLLFTPPIHDREQIRAWYCRADLFLFPSTFDTNGLVVREAAACGLASVLIRGSCAAEDVTDGQNAFLIDENADAMAAMLYKLCAAPERIRDAGLRAEQELYLSWEEAVAQAAKRYEVVIERYRMGQYPKRDHGGDEFFHSMAHAIEHINNARKIHTLLHQNREKLHEEAKDTHRRIQGRIRQDRQQLLHELKDEQQRILEVMQDYYRMMDRYL